MQLVDAYVQTIIVEAVQTGSVVGRVALAGSHEALSALSNSHRVVCRNGTERPNYHSGPPDRSIQLYPYRRGTPIPNEARIIQ